MENITFYRKIEDLQGKPLEERIKWAMEYEIPNKINLMPYLGKEKETVSYESQELVALCPVTGILDIYHITIEIKPDKFIPELKSLKMYFLEYKDLPIGHEHLAAKIFTHINKLVKPLGMKLRLIAAIRGGIKTEVNLSTKNYYLI